MVYESLGARQVRLLVRPLNSMTREALPDALPPLTLFDGLVGQARETLWSACRWRELAAGEELLREGGETGHVYVILRGRLEVLKGNGALQHRVHEIGEGEPVGEIAFFDREPRSATTRAIDPTVVLEIPFAAIEHAPALLRNLAQYVARRLRAASQDELESAQRRATMGNLVVKLLALLCGYALLVAAIPVFELGVTSTTYISLPLIAFFGMGAWRFMWRSGYPLRQFGLGLPNLLGSLFEAILLTPPFAALVVGIKWVAIQVLKSDAALFAYPDVVARLSDPTVERLLAIYLASSVVQELIVRCALQSSLEEFLVGPNRRRDAILVCALMFSVNHLHISLRFALLTFIPGLFWGLLFARRRHLVGPCLSHFVVGAFVFFVLGIHV
jgi:hypothetical protein